MTGSKKGAVFAGIVVSALAFEQLLWGHGSGLGLVLYILVLASVITMERGLHRLSSSAKLAGATLLVTTAMVLIYNSLMAVFAAWVALVTFSVLTRTPELRATTFVIPRFLLDLLAVPFRVFSAASARLAGAGSAGRGWYWIRIAALPILVALLYLGLYREASPRFEEFTASFTDGLVSLIEAISDRILEGHTLFFCLGLVLAAGAILRPVRTKFFLDEEQAAEVLHRYPRRDTSTWSRRSVMGLEKERASGVLLLTLVNGLVLLLNIFDIDEFWFGYSVPEGSDLKQLVHEGTWVLVTSIVLSMVILLHVFRGNQNFYERSRSLKVLAMLWVAQNAILGISVFLRNFHYINFHGLAYKRIGVLVFLLLVLIGLITLFVKIRGRRTLAYLLRVNSWAAFFLVCGLSFVDWDPFIVRYNLSHSNPAEIDVDHYLTMSDKVLPILDQQRATISRQIEKHSMNKVQWLSYARPDDFFRELDARIEHFKQEYPHRSWKELNLADRTAYLALQQGR